jgi:putative CocE/NonD family hydrolase
VTRRQDHRKVRECAASDAAPKRPVRPWRLRQAAAALALLAATALAGASPSLAKPPLTSATLQMNVHIPLRDGSYLNATLYRPAGVTAPVPVVFMLTPYAGDASHPSGSYFARHGLAYAFVDSRGRGDSPGVFTPLENDGPDGYDVVEWLAKQPWSDGHVAMFGGSYAGGDQWQVAALHPPHLTTIAPVASARAGVDFPAPNNIFQSYAVQWLTYTTGRPLYLDVFNDADLWSDLNKRYFLGGWAFSRLDGEAGNPNATFQTWLQHPGYDAYWRARSPSKAEVAGITLPMLVLTGSHDDDQMGTFSFLNDHITAADGALPANYYLVIGPWDHFGTREPRADVDDEHFGPASLLDVLRLHLDWYRHALLGEPKPAFLKKQVAYYVEGQGAECWKYADSLARITQRTQTLFLNAAGGAESLYRAGLLQETPQGATGAQWLSDPTDLRHAEAEKTAPGDDLHGDGLVFHSAPFAQDSEIDGQVRISLSLAVDGPDADLSYRLYLVTPDGKAHWLSDAAVRARYRHGLETGEPVIPGKIEAYDLTPGQWFAIRAPKGSRLRLVLQSLNSPDAQKNWNSTKPVAQQTSADAHRETIRLIQTPDHPSTIRVPFGDPAGECTASANW